MGEAQESATDNRGGATTRAVFAYVTVGNAAEANEIARALVSGSWAACANILPSMTSHYRWKGELQQDSEVVLIAKSTTDRLDGLIACVESLHSYDTPCVVALPIIGGSPGYLGWVFDQLATTHPATEQ